MVKLLFTIIFVSGSVSLQAQTKEGVKVTDLLQIKTAANIALNPDGSRAVFTVLSIEPDTSQWEYKYVTQLWTIATDGSQPRQLTFAKEGASQSKWSHDGKKIVFVRSVDGKPQLFLL